MPDLPESSCAAHESKKLRLSPPNYKRVCLVFDLLKTIPGEKTSDGWIRQQTWHDYYFYIVDCESASTHMNPTLRFERVPSMFVFAALNSTLYMFEAENPGDRRFAAKFELTPEIISGSEYPLKEEELCPITPMHYNKRRPLALVTPNGKSILVFSLKEVEMYSDCVSTFELYHVDDDKWELLPPIPTTPTLPQFQRRGYGYGYGYGRGHGLRKESFLNLKGYGFKTESHFAIEAPHDTFVLDLSVENKTWEVLSGRIPRFGSHFIIVEDGYFVNSHYFRDGKDNRLFDWPLSSSRTITEMPPSYGPKVGILADDQQDGYYHMCVVQGMTDNHEPDTCRLLMDIFSINLQKYKTDKQYHSQIDNTRPGPSPNIDRLKTLKLMLHGVRLAPRCSSSLMRLLTI